MARDASFEPVPVALATTDIPAVATALMDELRRRRLIVPGPSVIERLVAAATVLAERHVAHQLTRSSAKRWTHCC